MMSTEMYGSSDSLFQGAVMLFAWRSGGNLSGRAFNRLFHILHYVKVGSSSGDTHNLYNPGVFRIKI